MFSSMHEVRTWLELAYFVSAVLLAGAALYGLQQIRIMKRDIKVRSERAAREKALEYIQRYLENYVSLDGVFFRDCKERKLNGYEGPIGEFTLEVLPPEYLESSKARFELETWLPAVNELQVIGAAFAYGVADQEVGFEAIGRTFCETVRDKYDILCIARSHASCRHYEGIVALYHLWAPRLTKCDLTAIRKALDHRIKLIDKGKNKGSHRKPNNA